MTSAAAELGPPDATCNLTYEAWCQEFGRRVREARVRNNLTQHEVAAKVFGGGHRRQPYLSKIEQGRVNLTIKTVVHLSCAVGLVPVCPEPKSQRPDR